MMPPNGILKASVINSEATKMRTLPSQTSAANV